MDLMSIAQLLGNFGELFGAVAVVATLFYLARQIRQNSRQMEIQAHNQFSAALDGTDLAFSRFREFLITSEEVAAIWDKARDNFSALAGTERTRADQLLFEYSVLFHNFHARWGLVTGEQFGGDVMQSIRLLTAHDLESASVRDWWFQNNQRFTSPEFVQQMTTLVQEREDQS